MKSKGLLFVGAMVVSSLVSSVVLLPEEKAQDDVFMINVEALAEDETTGSVHCLCPGTVDCPLSEVKVKYVMSGWSLDR